MKEWMATSKKQRLTTTTARRVCLPARATVPDDGQAAPRRPETARHAPVLDKWKHSRPGQKMPQLGARQVQMSPGCGSLSCRVGVTHIDRRGRSLEPSLYPSSSAASSRRPGRRRPQRHFPTCCSQWVRGTDPWEHNLQLQLQRQEQCR